MLDIFSNVFGKSKKSSTTNGPPSLMDDSPGDAEGFVFVRPTDQTSNDAYQDRINRGVMLTNAMMMGSSSSIISNGSNNNNNNTSIGYPSLEGDVKMASSNYSPALPFSSPSAPASRMFSSKQTSSLIDNVPMVFTFIPSSGNGGASYGGVDDNDNDISHTINRVEQFVHGSNSLYTFSLENSIVRESLATTLN